MTLDKATKAARQKEKEAGFFLAKMREVEATSHSNLAEAEEHFGYYLSAFFSAIRSAPQIFAEVVGWDLINNVRNSWPDDEQNLERTLRKARNLTVHFERSSMTSSIEYVPQSQIAKEPRHPLDGYITITRPPGVPEVKIGKRKFTIRIAGMDVLALEACEKYLQLNVRIIDDLGTKS